MLKGQHGIIVTPVLEGNHHHHPPRKIQQQHSDPSTGHHSQNGSFRSKDSYQDADTPRTTSSEPKMRQNSQDFSRSFDVGSSHEVAALRKHLKILEERLRGERHTHAVKFSEIEKSLIQENAKLKVANAALERQVRRDQQQMVEMESEVTKLKKQDKKNRFSLSGITRSFSDVKLEEMEMKSSSLQRKNTDSEVIAMIKQRLSDSEKDRLEAESQFTQRISTLLRERNLERADFRAAEETILKLTGENSALAQTIEDLRNATNSTTNAPSNQIPILKRANQQLQEELDQLNREKSKLLLELENLSEELTLSKANERQSLEQAVLFDDMKYKIDSLRTKMASMERSRNSLKVTGRSDSSTEPATSSGRKVTELEGMLKQKQQELIDCHRKLVNILELSQRYEHHCYNLEKELSQVYGKDYKFVETDWRKRDLKFMKSVKSTLNRSAETQTGSDQSLAFTQTMPVNFISSRDQQQLDGLLSRLNSIISEIENSHGLESTKKCETITEALNHLSVIICDESSSRNAMDLERFEQDLKNMEKTNRSLQQQNKRLEEQLQFFMRTRDDESDDGIEITQAEIDEKIIQARIQATRALTLDKRNEEIVEGLARALLGSDSSPLSHYMSSGVFSARSSDSFSNGKNEPEQVCGKPSSTSMYLN